jgi:hypothetical protein
MKINNMDIFVCILIINAGFIGYFSTDITYMFLPDNGHKFFIDIIGIILSFIATLKISGCIKREVEIGKLINIKSYLRKTERVLIKRGMIEILSKVVDTEIKNCIDDPRYFGKPPDYLIKLKNDLSDCLHEEKNDE